MTSSCSVNKERSSPGDAEIQRASSDQSTQLLPVCTVQPEGSLQQQRGASPLLLPSGGGPGNLKDKKMYSACVYTLLPSAQSSGKMLGQSCFFLSFLSLSLSFCLAAAPIYSCDAPANEILASSVGTSFHQRWGYRERERERWGMDGGKERGCFWCS